MTDPYCGPEVTPDEALKALSDFMRAAGFTTSTSANILCRFIMAHRAPQEITGTVLMNRVQPTIGDAINEAEATGRREGLEEAARIAESSKFMAFGVARAIRAALEESASVRNAPKLSTGQD